MMDCTDRHCRVFHRMLSRHARLYSEMVTTGAVLFGDRQRILGFSPAEHPVALQLGGSDPAAMAEAASIGEAFGYDEININAGCPSDRVQSGRFGACLMAEPETVASCVLAMRRACQVPVTVKCRIGIDAQDSDRDLQHFAEAVAAAGCETLIVHARKAWLSGLSPKENRTIPPLNYDRVYRLKQSLPGLRVILNGGITDLDQAATHLRHVDGVMLGRAAYESPMILADVDRRFFNSSALVPGPQAVLEAVADYLVTEAAGDPSSWAMMRHVLGVYQGAPGARTWRRTLTEKRQREVISPGSAAAARLQDAMDKIRTAQGPAGVAA